jgi:hypothetical protein
VKNIVTSSVKTRVTLKHCTVLQPLQQASS